MLRLLLLCLVCLSLIQSGVVAPAVSTTTNAPFPIPLPIAPPVCVRSVPTCADPSSSVCDNLNHCRTLLSIVQSCGLTIFACVWVAVHRNIPGPDQKPLSIYYEWLKVVVLTLLVPEWILAWAVRQFLRARELASDLEDARATAQQAREEKHMTAMKTEENGRNASDDGEGAESEIGHRGRDEDGIPLRVIDRHLSSTEIKDAAAAGNVPDTWMAETILGRTKEPWTTTHAFFVIMGGFHYYADGEPLYPLSSEDVIDLVERGALVPPTSKELNDRSKGDALSKGVAIVQTLWFVMQCIARRIEHLPITSLEVMTLAYTVITVAMYAAWWHKPLNISCAVRVPGKAAEKVDADRESMWERIWIYILGGQDDGVTLSQERRVPTFWADCNGDEFATADVIALVVAMVFGAVHCIAWSYANLLHTEQLMWRLSAVTIVAVPVAMLLSFGLYFLIDKLSETLAQIGLVASWIVCGFAYVIARILLLVLSFTTLRSLPFGAYQTVQWTALIPHI